jgi:aerobic-type carbon monoxide dehydrogenase small subunit (CoxS/CutS family)
MHRTFATAARDLPAIQIVRVAVNGSACELAGDPGRRLADALRDELGLTGTKIGCHAGDCGACTVLLDGEQVCSCIVGVGQCDGRAVTTVEGLAGADGALSPLQRAFVAHGAAQCGICTPGMLMSAAALLRANQAERGRGAGRARRRAVPLHRLQDRRAVLPRRAATSSTLSKQARATRSARASRGWMRARR